tara:strand:+ start:164 stop:526 length:363 start_codon:yes stop_codon:yes gene_type:complete
MALEDLKSQYGPFNKKGKQGTGEVFDQLAGENPVGPNASALGTNEGLAGRFNASAYATPEPIGKSPSPFDTLAFDGKGNKGLDFARAKNIPSKYSLSSKPGEKPLGPDPLGNRPAERSFE